MNIFNSARFRSAMGLCLDRRVDTRQSVTRSIVTLLILITLGCLVYLAGTEVGHAFGEYWYGC